MREILCLHVHFTDQCMSLRCRLRSRELRQKSPHQACSTSRACACLPSEADKKKVRKAENEKKRTKNCVALHRYRWEVRLDTFFSMDAKSSGSNLAQVRMPHEFGYRQNKTNKVMSSIQNVCAGMQKEVWNSICRIESNRFFLSNFMQEKEMYKQVCSTQIK